MNDENIFPIQFPTKSKKSQKDLLNLNKSNDKTFSILFDFIIFALLVVFPG